MTHDKINIINTKLEYLQYLYDKYVVVLTALQDHIKYGGNGVNTFYTQYSITYINDNIGTIKSIIYGIIELCEIDQYGYKFGIDIFDYYTRRVADPGVRIPTPDVAHQDNQYIANKFKAIDKLNTCINPIAQHLFSSYIWREPGFIKELCNISDLNMYTSIREAITLLDNCKEYAWVVDRMQPVIAEIKNFEQWNTENVMNML